MRISPHGVALAAVVCVISPAPASEMPRAVILAQGASATDVTKAKRCAPPFGCQRKPTRAPAPAKNNSTMR